MIPALGFMVSLRIASGWQPRPGRERVSLRVSGIRYPVAWPQDAPLRYDLTKSEDIREANAYRYVDVA
ncbi:hypothetical protein G8D25_19160 [Ralstonia solanacearum]|uniref:hypothetical protein n=1 Tax=Ralstonia solanacearum TaxID=305 RepID=UPI00144A03F8|nr:hypothetical protein [Ralstonia solanacearum]QJC26134.1 hypothetical protein G8D25_19160 [Ralstonia solanacearum]